MTPDFAIDRIAKAVEKCVPISQAKLEDLKLAVLTVLDLAHDYQERNKPQE